MKCEVPIISSIASYLPEVCGEEVKYLNQSSTEEITGAMRITVFDEKRHF
tara:strand:+ start:1396 stop:1545 length:150 start_codon:yes stop_codon:yes gene_type:complete